METPTCEYEPLRGTTGFSCGREALLRVLHSQANWPYPAWRERCLRQGRLGRQALVAAYRDPGDEWQSTNLGGLA